MDQVRRVLAEIRTYLGKLSVSQQLLIATTVVIAVMALFIVAQYAGGPKMEPLPGIAVEDQPRVMLALQRAGIRSELRGGAVFVAAGTQRQSIAHLGETGDLPDDTTILFNNLLSKQDWRHSREQHRQQYLFALQNELGRVISQFKGVRSATVIIDAPEREGLGRSSRAPSASVTVFPSGGALDQATVDAVASLVSGARSGLIPENVSVVDGTTRRQHRVTDGNSALAGAYLEQRGKVEADTRQKLEGLLSYIPGVIVAVTAQVDVTRVSEQTRKHLKENEGSVSMIRSESASTSSQGGGARGAEPGVRSMQGADINQGTSSATKASSQEQIDTEFENAIGMTVRDLVDPRGMPTFLAASVNVPESYVVELLRAERSGGEGQPENPAPDAVRARFDDIRAQIEASVLPHLKTRGEGLALVDGEVQVTMIPTSISLATAASGSGGGALFGLVGGEGGGLTVGGSLVDTVVLGGLAIVALSMMVMMVRRSSKKIELPSAEELVGMPQTLETHDDLVGEADEGESALAGIEIGDDDLERNKMLDQIGDLIQAEPDKVAMLIRRWVAVED